MKNSFLYVSLYSSFVDDIKKGILLPGTKLPSIRSLAQQKGLSRNTVAIAYNQLLAEGYIQSKERSGYIVCDLDYSVLKNPLIDTKDQKPINHDSVEITLDLSSNQVDSNLFPYSVLRKLYREVVSKENVKKILQPSPNNGLIAFRKNLSTHLHISRGIQCSYEQIVIGAGTEYLLQLLLPMLSLAIKEKLICGIENPGYNKIKRILQDTNCQITEIPLDSQGLQATKLNNSENLVYVTPSHQYPLGITMPISRRTELLHWVYEKNNRYIIEDDYDSDYRYNGKTIPALQSMDTQNRVIYIGTFSRSLSPSMRIAYAVLPMNLITCLNSEFGYYNSTVSTIEQEVLSKFIAEGHFERHVNRTRKFYLQRRNSMLSLLQEKLPDYPIFGEEAGLHFILSIPEKIATTIEKKAIDRQLKISVIHNRYILIGYAHLTEEQISQAVTLLVELLHV